MTDNSGCYIFKDSLAVCVLKTGPCAGDIIPLPCLGNLGVESRRQEPWPHPMVVS